MKKTVYEFVDLIKTLRAPGGCPWDREQTHESIMMNVLEEAYEVYDAIDEGDDEKTKDELGDLLMQIVFHAIMGEEDGKYDLDDIAGNVYEKMVRRHPHVFGKNALDKSSEVLVKWDKIKSEEKGFTSYSQRLYDVIRALPALKRSEKLLKRADKAGFDYEGKGLTESAKALESAKKGEKDAEQRVGDLLFYAVNEARRLSVDPEQALESANKRFISHFAEMESSYKGTSDFSEVSAEEKKNLWVRTEK